MDFKDRMEICKKCKNSKDDLIGGYICNITRQKRYFETTCPDFQEKEQNPAADIPKEIKTWQCPRCGKINEPQKNTCLSCNFKLVNNDDEKIDKRHLEYQTPTWKCPVCSSLNDENMRGCLNCGFIPKESEKQKFKTQTETGVKITTIQNDTTQTQPLKLATVNQRFINYLIDTIVFMLIVQFLFTLFSVVVGNFADAVYTLFNLIAYYILYASFEGSNSKTIGKLLTNTKVVDVNGDKPTTKQILVRTLCRAIPFEPFSIFADNSGIMWHDKISGTRVVVC